MVTYAEILDSAVKIGLGAVISGVATYYLAKLNSKQDFSKNKRDLLERISLAVERSAGMIAREMMMVHRLDRLSEDKKEQALQKAEDTFLKAADEHNIAEGLAALLGSPDLTRTLRSYGESALDLQNVIQVKPLDHESHNVVIGRINSTRDEINSAIKSAYEKTAA